MAVSKNQRKGGTRCTCYRVIIIRNGKRVKGDVVKCGLNTCPKEQK